MDRRNFFKLLGISSASIAAQGLSHPISAMGRMIPPEKPHTNIDQALKIPRTKNSMPGLFKGKVVKITDTASVDANDQIVDDVAYAMLAESIQLLTGKKNLKKAWRMFVGPKDRIGIKINPIGGLLLSTSHAVTKAILSQLKDAGIPMKNVILWDRRQEDMQNAGFTSENYPDVQLRATETMENGSFYGKDGKLLGLDNIDREWAYVADVEESYDSYTIPYMINEGKESYFSKICTQQVDKIINVPIMKNAGTAVTVCMKNLAFGSISNTSRLHGQLWHEACAQVPAFAPLRDKVVLNIADGLIGCYDGGPAANPQFICRYNTLLVGSDPVAVDRIAHEIIIGKRIAQGRQEKDSANGYRDLTLAQQYGLGVADIDKIDLIERIR